MQRPGQRGESAGGERAQEAGGARLHCDLHYPPALRAHHRALRLRALTLSNT